MSGTNCGSVRGMIIGDTAVNHTLYVSCSVGTIWSLGDVTAHDWTNAGTFNTDFTHVAGVVSASTVADGTGTDAQFVDMGIMAFAGGLGEQGSLYIVDGNLLRLMDIETAVVSTILPNLGTVSTDDASRNGYRVVPPADYFAESSTQTKIGSIQCNYAGDIVVFTDGHSVRFWGPDTNPTSTTNDDPQVFTLGKADETGPGGESTLNEPPNQTGYYTEQVRFASPVVSWASETEYGHYIIAFNDCNNCNNTVMSLRIQQSQDGQSPHYKTGLAGFAWPDSDTP